jgi:hypothetical protein
MKTLKLMIIVPVVAIFMLNSSAKGQSIGLYLTIHDYLNHKLSYGDSGDKIRINGLFGSANVVLTHDGKKQVFAKSEIFGYHANSQDYRFYNNNAYKILDTIGFYLYSTEKLVQQGKGPKPTTVYCFSKKGGDQILPLTPEYIAKEYPQNYKLKYMVEVASKAAINLDTYDKSSNMYKIKELYTESLK